MLLGASGTIVSPFIMSYALANRTWNSGYRMVGLIQLGIALLLLVTLPVWNVNQSTSREDGKSVGLTGALKIKGVPFLLLGFSLTVLQKLRLCSGQVPILLR